MRSNARLSIIITVIAALGTIGVIETVWAAPDGPQRLRGLEGRIFQVEGVELDEDGLPIAGTEFDNCYYFNDGNWVDPLFLEGLITPGQWIQHSSGAKTNYTATAEVDVGVIITLIQDGTVSPAGGKGTLQLEAFSTVLVNGDVVAEILSIGNEVEECPFLDLPNVPPI